MKLPHAERAQVSPEKLSGYLLSETHPIGRFKARFFQALGYRADAWEVLEHDLLEAARTGDAARIRSPYGDKYEIPCTLKGPSGLSAPVMAVWIIHGGYDIPRFVTAYPAE